MLILQKSYEFEAKKLPQPEFYTFYNGNDNMEAEKILYLSDAYKVKDCEPMLELKVRVININSKVNHEILEKCHILKEYSLFIDMIRKYQKLGVEDAYAQAIRECIKQDILADYLQRKGSEVENMLIAEYDYDMDMEVQREEAKEEGLKTGKNMGRLSTLIQLIVKKIQKDYSVEQITEMLEEDPAVVKHIYDVAKKYAPGYDEEKICTELIENRIRT